MRTKVMTRTIFGWKLKGTKKQLDEMHYMLNHGYSYCKDFNKYFISWVQDFGVYYFPRLKHFVKANGTTDYHEALIKQSNNPNICDYLGIK